MSTCNLVSKVRIKQQTVRTLWSVGLGTQHPITPRDKTEGGEQEVTNAAIQTLLCKERKGTLSLSRVDNQLMATKFNKPRTMIKSLFLTHAIAVLRDWLYPNGSIADPRRHITLKPHCNPQRTHYPNTPIAVPGGHITLMPSLLFPLVGFSISSQLYIVLQLSGFKTNFYYNNLFIPVPNYSIRKGHF